MTITATRVVTIILGRSLLFGDLGGALYGLAARVVTATFVRWYEEPTLMAQFGGRVRRVPRRRAGLAAPPAPAGDPDR